MRYKQKVNWLDEFENLLTKAEMSRRDIDEATCIILILRYLYIRLREEVKNESDRQIKDNT